jgi:hypothetical protein
LLNLFARRNKKLFRIILKITRILGGEPILMRSRKTGKKKWAIIYIEG